MPPRHGGLGPVLLEMKQWGVPGRGRASPGQRRARSGNSDYPGMGFVCIVFACAHMCARMCMPWVLSGMSACAYALANRVHANTHGLHACACVHVHIHVHACAHMHWCPCSSMYMWGMLCVSVCMQMFLSL